MKLRNAAAACVLLTCGGSSTKFSFTKVSKIEPGADCRGGGVRLATGLDKNDNRVLDDNEITQTEIVCSDTAEQPPTTMASRSAAVAAGSAECSRGGVKIELGLDNGDGGGVAHDGVLQDGEVDDSRLVCQSIAEPVVGSLDSPGGANGTATISTRGGDSLATDQSTGVGGSITIGMARESHGGHVKVFKTGSVVVEAPAVPVAPTASARTCVMPAGAVLLPSDTSPPGGAPDGCWVHDATQRLMKQTDAASGLVVQASTSLVVPTDLRVEGFVDNRGSLRASGTAAFTLTASAYFSAPNSELANLQSLTVTVDTFVNAGTVKSSATALTSAFPLTITAMSFSNSGTIEAKGQNGTSGADITISALLGYFHSGTIDASGSNNAGGVGGNGGDIDLKVSGGPSAISSGSYVSSGGNGSTNNKGGDGGKFDLNATLQGLRLAGSIVSRAGAGQGSGVGGDGGAVHIVSSGSSTHCGATIDARGGNGSVGGKGGALTFVHSPSSGAELILFGYESIDARSGGVGFSANGGSITLGHPQEAGALTGAVLNEVALLAGPGTGSVRLQTGLLGQDFGVEKVINRGAISVNGLNQNKGASIALFAKNAVENHAPLTANGGTGECCFSPDSGGDGGDIGMISVLGSITNDAALNSQGGPGLAGGNGGRISLTAATVSNTGDASASGGNTSLPGNAGGRGGIIHLRSTAGTTTNSGTLSAAAGSAGAIVPVLTGTAGSIYIDGVLQ